MIEEEWCEYELGRQCNVCGQCDEYPPIEKMEIPPEQDMDWRDEDALIEKLLYQAESEADNI